MIEKSTGHRPTGWSSPSVYPNAETLAATAAEGIRYTLGGMDSDVLSRLATRPNPLVLLPYPPQIVDMGQYLARNKEASELERLWIDYVRELTHEAAADPERAMRRVLQAIAMLTHVWVTDTEAVMKAAGQGR